MTELSFWVNYLCNILYIINKIKSKLVSHHQKHWDQTPLMSRCDWVDPQAYLQQAQELVLLETIVLQTLGKLQDMLINLCFMKAVNT